MKKYMAEMLGTLFFVLIIGLSGGDALTVGLALAVLVFATGAISGGHLNPAVTLSLAIGKKISWNTAVQYWIWQIIGAIVGALIFWAIKGSTMLVIPSDGYSLWQILSGEFIFTFLLAMVVYLVAVAKQSAGNSYWGFAIGLTVFIGIMCVGNMTGGVFNPAVATGPALVDMLNGSVAISYLWIYLVAQLLGGALAGTFIYCSKE